MPHLGSGQIDLIGLFGGEEGADGGLVDHVEFGVAAGDDVRCRVTLSQQLKHDRRAHHAKVASYVDLGCVARKISVLRRQIRLGIESFVF